MSGFMISRTPWPVFGLTLAACLHSSCAWSHAFGQRYDLPLPLSLYLWGAGSAVAASFLIAVLFLRSPGSRGWSLDLSRNLLARCLTAVPVRVLLKLLSMCLFALVLVSGLAGDQNPATNFAPVFVWVIWWVGLAYVAAFIGNLWDLVNPWCVIYEAATKLLPRLATPLFDYPAWLSSWPALVLFFVFAYLEFISGVAQRPATLSWLIIGYSTITFIGMRLFGLDTWKRHGEAFSVVFGLMARFGSFHGHERALILRPPGFGLLSGQPLSTSMMAFTVLMLSTVSFDGFIETPLWAKLNAAIYSPLMATGPVAELISPAGLQRVILSAALVLFYLLYLGVYLLFSSLTSRLSAVENSAVVTARVYVLSLVPIAIAYHLAHYLSYLLISGQLMIPILSDPLGLGWDLFGTRHYSINIGLIDAGDVWILSVCAIVAGHIAAVCVAHATALRRERYTRDAIISQLPMLVLMIAYTMISLWILSQPIIAT